MIENRAGKWVVLSSDGAVLSEHPSEAVARTADAGAPRADVLRLDASAAVRTDSGFLRVPARITRTGIMEYHRGGRVVRELRRPDEVFRADSISTLAGVPLTKGSTHGHPVQFVTPRDTREHAVGYVESDVTQADGRYLDATLMVWRSDAIDAIERRELTELSAGYRSKVRPAAGVWQGQAYDLEQVDIRYNHVALLPPGIARGGSELSLRLDSHDLITLLRERLTALGLPDAELAARLGLPDADGVRLLLDGDMGIPGESLLTRAASMIHVPIAELLTLAAPPPNPRRIPSMKRQITLNGITFEIELPDPMAGAFDSAVTAERTATAQVRTDATETAAKLAATEAERDEIKAERDALQARCDAADLERVREQAKAVFADAQGATVRELQVSVLAHLEHEIRADASDAEIAGAFAFAVKHAAKGKPEGQRSIGASAKPEPRTDAAESAEAARKRMLDRNRNAWRPENKTA